MTTDGTDTTSGDVDDQMHDWMDLALAEATTGADRGEVPIGAVVVVDGKVIVGSNDDHVHMVALADGKEIWKFKTGDAVTASPAVADGRVVIGSTDGFVYCFGAKKKL